MKPHDIHALLIRKQITQSQLAKELGCTVQAVNGVVKGHWTSVRVCKHIADRLGKDVKRLWPDLEV